MQLFRGNIITCDRKNTVHKYLVEDKGRIIHVGDQLPRTFKHSEQVYDLEEKALLPAFGDGHIHFSIGLCLIQLSTCARPVQLMSWARLFRITP